MVRVSESQQHSHPKIHRVQSTISLCAPNLQVFLIILAVSIPRRQSLLKFSFHMARPIQLRWSAFPNIIFPGPERPISQNYPWKYLFFQIPNLLHIYHKTYHTSSWKVATHPNYKGNTQSILWGIYTVICSTFLYPLPPSSPHYWEEYLWDRRICNQRLIQKEAKWRLWASVLFWGVFVNFTVKIS